MENTLIKVNINLERFNINSLDIINNNILIYNNNLDINYKYKITNYLGKGSVGQVYMLEPINFSTDKKYIIKISKSECQKNLIKEVELVEKYFNRDKIKHNSYPIFWGEFDNLTAIGVIYQYLGFYNLEKIKKNNYKIKWENNIKIIIQIINQLIMFTNIIHGDLKASNIVIDNINNDIIATIIDFGLIKKKNSKKNIISTNYITSPESLLSLDKYSENIDYNDLIDFSKHDYYGLYTIILNLFLKNGYWPIINYYLVNQVKISSFYIIKQEAIDIFTYMYYKFFYNNCQDLPNDIYRKLIYNIELDHPLISTKQFYNFDNFYKLYIEPNIDYTIFNIDYLPYFKDFLIKICNFDPSKRAELNELLTHPFLQL
jgi:serine/threonine protein kinase